MKKNKIKISSKKPNASKWIENPLPDFDLLLNKKTKETTDCKHEHCELLYFRIGLDIELPISVKEFLRSIVNTPKKRFHEIKNPKKAMECFQNGYDIKVYDKGRQLKLKNDNLLRIELEVKEKQHLNRLGIITLADLKKPKTIRLLTKLFNKVFVDVVFYCDEIDRRKLSPTQNAYLADHLHPQFWAGEIIASNNKKLTKKEVPKHIKDFDKFIQEHTNRPIKTFVLSEIKKKTSKIISAETTK